MCAYSLFLVWMLNYLFYQSDYDFVLHHYTIITVINFSPSPFFQLAW